MFEINDRTKIILEMISYFPSKKGLQRIPLLSLVRWNFFCQINLIIAKYTIADSFDFDLRNVRGADENIFIYCSYNDVVPLTLRGF